VNSPAVFEGKSQEVPAIVTRDHTDTERLLERAGGGDPVARQELLVRHRDRLRRMVAFRLDRRLAARLDPSDIVQESLAQADRQLSDYLRRRPLPFYPWLRQFAWERVAKEYERHVQARRRSVTREEPPPLPDESVGQLARRLITSWLRWCGALDVTIAFVLAILAFAVFGVSQRRTRVTGRTGF
jgi:hypothetical protein